MILNQIKIALIYEVEHIAVWWNLHVCISVVQRENLREKLFIPFNYI